MGQCGTAVLVVLISSNEEKKTIVNLLSSNPHILDCCSDSVTLFFLLLKVGFVDLLLSFFPGRVGDQLLKNNCSLIYFDEPSKLD